MYAWITGVYVKTVEMGMYHKMYGDYAIVDGSHNMSKHAEMKFIPLTGVCALGHSCILAYGLCPEALEYLVSMSKKVGIMSLPVLMSDQAQSFSNYANFLGATPLLCSWHFKEDFVKVTGLDTTQRQAYLTQMSALLYKDYEDEWSLNENFQEMKTTYSEIEPAMCQILNLESKKGQLCLTVTKNISRVVVLHLNEGKQ